MYALIGTLNVAFIFLLSFWVWRREDVVWRKVYWPALATKLLAGIALGIIYSSYYDTSDTFIFFDLAVEKAVLARTDFPAYLDFLVKPNEGYFLGEHRLVMFVKVMSIFSWLSYDSYWIVSLYCSVISFFSTWHLTKTIARLFPTFRVAACIAFLFFPSVVFWSSGLIKESLAMAGLFYLTALFVRLWMGDRISVWATVPAILAFWVVFSLKYYYLAAFIPVTASALLVRFIAARTMLKSVVAQIGVWMVLLICGIGLITLIHPNFSPAKLLTVIVSNNEFFMRVCAPDDVIHFYNLNPTWASMVINSPWAFFSGVFRPFVWEANTIFKMITALMNLVLLILTCMSLPALVRIKNSPHRLLIFSAVLYIVLLSIFLALSTPNFGTLTRYNVGYLPFVVLLVMQHQIVNKILPRIL